MTRDPAELADAFLDDDLPAGEWDTARAADPVGCDRALAGARAQRAAIAGLARPALPDVLRQRILAATSAVPMTVRSAAPAPGRPWWHYALPAALAAGLMLAVWLPTRSEATRDPLPTTVARHQQAVTAPAEEVKREIGANQTSEPTVTAAHAPRPAAGDTDQSLRAEATAGQGAADAKQDDGPAAATAATQPPPVAQTNAVAPTAPSPIALHLAWRRAVRRDAADATDTPAVATETTDRAATVAKPAPVAPAAARAPVVDAKAASTTFTAESAAPAEALADEEVGRDLLITLRNETVGDLRVAAGGIRLVCVAADGRAVWRRTLRGESATVVPAGRSLSWTQPITVLPPGIARLRLEVDGQRSIEIEP